MDWNTLTIAAMIIFGMLSSFWMGSRLAQGKDVLPSTGKIEIIEPEQPAEDKYGDIFPKDRVPQDEYGEL